ncbi:hypothetical protein NX059_000297 [Plenodomus lindquistii]|nr:hypothetical protein NX059_000297 [Plenodomus lindquistii]
MNPSDRTKEALLNKTESLCNAITDVRNPDPWAGNGYLSNILRLARLADASNYSNVEELEPGLDYATSAGREMGIRGEARGLIKTAQDLATLIRDLQELWLFGGLDTLSDPKDEEESRRKAMAVAEMLESLAKGGPVKRVEKEESGKNGMGEEGEKKMET